jgi:hypothetical protein
VKRESLLCALTAAAIAACGGSDSSVGAPPADFAGKYSISVKNVDNGCNYQNWNVGQTAQNVEFDITQSGSNVTGNVRGVANIYFAALGIGALDGTASGTSASMDAVGTTSVAQGKCAYFVRAVIDLTLTGNTVNGTVTYSNQTNGSPDCGALTTCSSRQEVAGSRPPK